MGYKEARHWKSGGRPGPWGTELTGHVRLQCLSKGKWRGLLRGVVTWGAAGPSLAQITAGKGALCQPQARLCRGYSLWVRPGVCPGHHGRRLSGCLAGGRAWWAGPAASVGGGGSCVWRAGLAGLGTSRWEHEHHVLPVGPSPRSPSQASS